MAKRPAKNPNPAISSYWDRVQWPLQSLYFLLPMLLLYELGTAFHQPGGQQMLPILAESLLARFFHAFGGFGLRLPGLLVVVLLLFQHLSNNSKQPWKPEWRLQPFMWLESLAFSLPLFAFAMVLFRQPAPAVATDTVAALTHLGHTATSIQDALLQNSDLQLPATQFGGMLLAVGAGIYEELLFRLIGITLLHLVLSDVFKLKQQPAMWLSVAISAIAFALYHFNAHELADFHNLARMQWGRMSFYAMAGCYFGLIYALRGFGVVVMTHALYDLMFISLFYLNQ